jgi:hypothetical protein
MALCVSLVTLLVAVSTGAYFDVFVEAGSGAGHGAATAESAQEKTVTVTGSTATMGTATDNPAPNDPFLVSNGLTPPAAQYQGPMFRLSHDWPSQPLPAIKNPPWLQAIGGGAITTENAAAYVAALKEYVGANARQLLLDYPHWDAARERWYNEPWLGSTRESIHGTYAAGQFGPSIFPGTGLKTTFDTHVLTYYDERAAYTLFKVWGADAMNPDVKTGSFQFAEGSVIVKAALFASDDPTIQKDWWPVTDGAAAWPIMRAIPVVRPGGATVLNAYVMQFDIIVKDSVASPKTGWVFATLIYDRNAKGDAWDKMVPLGATWGNDPGIDSSQKKAPRLQETWINSAAPKYSQQTLGWGGRLAGPNDGARNDIQVGKKAMENHPNSSCMSCHGPAEWQPAQHRQASFLLPSYANPQPGPPYKTCPEGKPGEETVCSPAPGSPEWLRWFQDRAGTEAQDPDTASVATDYDMVFAFKTLPMWWKAVGAKDAAMPFAMRSLRHGTEAPAQFNEYNGAPLKVPPAGPGTPGVPKAMHW